MGHARVVGVLKNPSYAGVYVYGRYKYAKMLTESGKIIYQTKKLPIESWPVTIQNHHEGYITWEAFLKNQNELDPSNRLVAATLETRWNDSLEKLEEITKQYGEYKSKNKLDFSIDQKQKLFSLAKDLPRLWNSQSTNPKDRKRILRLLIKDITVEKPARKKLIFHIRWQGGTCEDLAIDLLPDIAERIRYPNEIVEKVRTLSKSLSDQEIVEEFNSVGMKSAKGKKFTFSMIEWIRYKHKISSVEFNHPDELTVKQLSNKFDVNCYVVYYWIGKKYLTVRRKNKGSQYWITLTKEKEKELKNWIKNSSKIYKVRELKKLKYQKRIVGGAI
ncbi:MAG: recombinase family protein [Oligoflexia bacterium]|nr:recombinase family protein [Oligoflexia bacterium]